MGHPVYKPTVYKTGGFTTTMSAVRAKERKTENGESCGKITSPEIKYTECTKSDPNRVIQWSLKNMKQRKIQTYIMSILHNNDNNT